MQVGEVLMKVRGKVVKTTGKGEWEDVLTSDFFHPSPCDNNEMNRYTFRELADMHLCFGASDGNALAARRLYAERYPQRRLPAHTTFTTVDRNLGETGHVQGHGRQGGGRNPAVRDAIEDEVLNRVDNNPSTSTRCVAGHLGVSHSSVWRVWHRFGLHPYHKQKVQTLNPNDYPHRVNYCQWYLQKCQEDPDFPSLVLHSDEAMFSEEGILNTRNNIFWAAENPHATYEHGRQNKFRVNVWAGILGNYIIGPYLLPDRLNGQNYLVFLREVLPELLRNENIPDDVIENMWLQHDGAPAHYARAVRDYLNVTFPLRWIGRGGPVPWPARSPDLTPLDFFFWGCMKDLVYATPPESELDLVARIVAAAHEIREKGILEEVRNNLSERCNRCIEVNGANFEHLLV